MTGYTVHTGSNEKFSSGWDKIFGDGKPAAATPKKAEAKAAKATKKAAKSGKKR